MNGVVILSSITVLHVYSETYDYGYATIIRILRQNSFSFLMLIHYLLTRIIETRMLVLQNPLTSSS